MRVIFLLPHNQNTEALPETCVYYVPATDADPIPLVTFHRPNNLTTLASGSRPDFILIEDDGLLLP